MPPRPTIQPALRWAIGLAEPLLSTDARMRLDDDLKQVFLDSPESWAPTWVTGVQQDLVVTLRSGLAKQWFDISESIEMFDDPELDLAYAAVVVDAPHELFLEDIRSVVDESFDVAVARNRERCIDDPVRFFFEATDTIRRLVWRRRRFGVGTRTDAFPVESCWQWAMWAADGVWDPERVELHRGAGRIS